ncbi:hypothetical protein ACFQ88_39395 [Paenibacillus sp. NPDC056579]|uniref:hypothetical protein n=1 Tax=Paenibacillus sp. NPDC056579 TaxID=3345871 RepID=UPI0036753ABF
MGKSTTSALLNNHSYLMLKNRHTDVTHAVSVDHTFLTDIFNLEKSYASDNVIMFRRNSHPIRKYHVTEMSLRVMMTISRRFNTQGTLTGVPIHRLFQLMNDEYEELGSKEQFYAEIQKFMDLGLLSVSQDGLITEWKIESFKRETGRFVLFNPLVFTKAFTQLPVAAQKLYLYIVSRNGDKINKEFKEFFGGNSWINTLTHKSRPCQIRKLLELLSALEPVQGHRLFLKSSVEKDSLGRWFISCVLNPTYLIKQEKGKQYRLVPKAKIPYTRTVTRLRTLFHYYKIGDIEHIENGRVFLRLAQLLHNESLKTLRFVAMRIREMYERNGLFLDDLVHAIKVELQDRTYITFMDIVKDTGVYRYLGMGEGGALDDVRPLQFYRAVKDRFTISEFKSICKKALPLLREKYGDQLNNEIIFAYHPIRPGMPIHYDSFYLEDFLNELKSEMDSVLTA